MPFSITITGLLTTILGIWFPIEEVSKFLDAAVSIVGLVLIWWGRIRLGDLTWYGTRK